MGVNEIWFFSKRVVSWKRQGSSQLAERTSARDLRRSTVNGSSPIVRARNSGNVCPDSDMIAAYCPQLSCHGLAIVATKLSFAGGYRLLLKRGRSRFLLTFWPNRLSLISRSLKAAV